jgi:hypothetical protein
MKNQLAQNKSLLLVLTAVLTALGLVACDNELNISPTAPSVIDIDANVEALRTLHIQGSLRAATGSCVRATILFDGQEILGARTRCPDPDGCAEIALEGVISAFAGRHTITFQVLRQADPVQEYLAAGEVAITRAGIELPNPAELELAPLREELSAGQGVTYTIDLVD